MARRVLHLITRLDHAGAEGIVWTLCDQAQQVEAEVACLQGGDFVDAFQKRGITVHDLGMKHKADCSVLGRLRQLFKHQRYHLCHTHLIHAHAIGRWALPPGMPTVGTTHVIEERFRPWHRWAEHWSAHHSGAVTVGVSQSVCDHLIHTLALDPSKVRCIKNGIDLSAFSDASESGRDIDLLFVGRLDQQKGLDKALKALQGSGLSLTIAGDGPQRMMLEALGQSLGLNLRFLGFRQDVPDLMKRAKLVIVPSRWEGFGLVVAEALAAGCQVLAEPLPVLKEVGGDCVHFERAGDEAWLPKVKSLITNFAVNHRGRQRVQSHFSQERMVQEYENLYEEILV